MVTQENRKSPRNTRNPSKQSQIASENGENLDNTDSSLFSPRFKSVAAMAGWDEETLLLASLVVEDTPERNFKRNKRSDLHFKTPPTNSRGKRRARRQSPSLIPVTVLNLDDDDDDESTGPNQGGHEKKKAEVQSVVKSDSPQKVEETATASCSSSRTLPCIDRLREELSCAICLEICFEPSTTPCGHSFCKKCLKSAADKCGKRCPKCRQLISNARSCTVNTVLWNTIQLLFPEEVQTRKAAEEPHVKMSDIQNSERISQSSNNLHVTRRRLRRVGSRRGDEVAERRGVPHQDNDAVLALRLQREEFMAIYTGSSLARENLRAMAQRAINNRTRNRAV